MKIVCRCEDVTEEDIIKEIRNGCTTLEELKQRLRLGMGSCQGRTCLMLALRILAKETGKGAEEISLPPNRPPVVPVPIGLLADEYDRES